MSVFAGNHKLQVETPEVLPDYTADILAGAAERRLAATNDVLVELRTEFPPAFVLATGSTERARRQATSEPVPAHLQRYADEVDRWHLEARAARVARGPEWR